MANLAGCQRSTSAWFDIGLCLLFLVHGSYATETCGGAVYDITNLRTTSNWTFYWVPKEGTGCLGDTFQTNCSIFISFCHPIKCIGNDASACLLNSSSPTPKDSYMLAGYNKSENPFKDANGDVGFYVEFPKGGRYNTSDGQGCDLMLNLTFKCNESYPWNPPLDGSQAVIDKGAINSNRYDEKTCKYHIEFLFAGACPQLAPLPSEIINQLSTGSVLLIIFFVALTLYFTVGVTINCVQGRKGMELLPHNELWVNLPSYITEGFTFTFSCCGAKVAGRSYESI